MERRTPGALPSGFFVFTASADRAAGKLAVALLRLGPIRLACAGTTAFNKAKADYNGTKAGYNQQVAAYNAAKAARNTNLPAVQSAIWQVTSNRNVSSSDAAFDLLVDNLSANPKVYFARGYTDRFAGIQLITPVQQYGGKNGKPALPLTQSFVFATGAAPSPALGL